MGDEAREFLREECGLAAAIDIPMASEIVRDMLQVMQHRGEAGAGIVSSYHQNIHSYKNLGKVSIVFPKDFDFKNKVPGKVAIGHNRYPTRGSAEELCNIQPLLFKDTKYGQLAIAHNGQLVDVNNYRSKLRKNGALFQSTSDSETLAHLIGQSKKKTLEDAIASEITKIPLAYSLLIMTKDKLFALRDQHGVRPLSIAKIFDRYLLASETNAFRIFDDYEFVRDVNPGEMVIFDKKSVRSEKGFKSIHFATGKEHWCIFEGIYFSEPRSEYNGYMHEDFRQQCGMKIYNENNDFFNKLKKEYENNIFIIPILDSGKQGAIGFQKVSNIPYKEYFLRRHNAQKSEGRSYTASTQEEREIIAHMKLDLRKEKVEDKVVITVDDSNVRGTTARKNNLRLKKAGAKMIINVFLSPMIKHPCYMGMDHQTQQELIAYKHNEEDIARETSADKTIYLSLQGLNDVVTNTYKCDICSGCFGGNYPAKIRN
ncbi:MAG: amidophosphoribosyltransferase [Candidatus Woesearchaeota archaeon]|jgi:amidophosphoribosyltransferase